MRYIMILGLCLVGFEGYAASAEMGVTAPCKKYFTGAELADILKVSFFRDAGKTWYVHSIYKYNPYVRNCLLMDQPIVDTEIMSTDVVIRMLSAFGVSAGIQMYAPTAMGSSPYLNSDDTKMYYYASDLNPTLYVVFNLKKPESTH